VLAHVRTYVAAAAAECRTVFIRQVGAYLIGPP
jgi:hypothetical protein